MIVVTAVTVVPAMTLLTVLVATVVGVETNNSFKDTMEKLTHHGVSVGYHPPRLPPASPLNYLTVGRPIGVTTG
jgi:hypothetical protein